MGVWRCSLARAALRVGKMLFSPAAGTVLTLKAGRIKKLEAISGRVHDSETRRANYVDNLAPLLTFGCVR